MPLVGARRREGLSESLGTCDVGFTTVDLSRVEAAVPSDAGAGQRYASHAMRTWVANAMSVRGTLLPEGVDLCRLGLYEMPQSVIDDYPHR